MANRIYNVQQEGTLGQRVNVENTVRENNSNN